MASVRDDLDSFHHFVVEKLASGPSAASLEELFMQWSDGRSRDEINEAIRRGLADVEAGRHQPADEAMESIRQELGLSKE